MLSRLALPCLVATLAAALGAAEGGKDAPAPSQDYLDNKAALEAMLTSRDVEEYEVDVTPLALDRVLLKDRLGREHLFHYLTFRIRNQITEDSKALAANATRYNEILQKMAAEYEFAKVENGVTLAVDGEKVLDRADKRAKTRTLNLSVLAYDENGSRIDLLDEPIGSGPQKGFNIPDYGDYVAGSPLAAVRDKVEEAVGRRLLTLDEIHAKELPPYDATQMDAEGVAAGEVYGVVVFNRLNDQGDAFTIEMRGVSNKLRTRSPETAKGEVENYANTRVLRRVYVLHYSRPGDEFFRDQDRFVLDRGGWEWVDTFQRLSKRADVAYADYFLDNLEDEKGQRNTTLEEGFWPYYSKVREAHPDAGDKLPDLQKALENR
jgi:hypothetical protein